MEDKSSSEKEQEPEELARFREQWRAEVQQRKAQQQAPVQGESSQSDPARRPRTGVPPRKGKIPEDGPAPSFGGFTPLGYAPIPRSAPTRAETTILTTGKIAFTAKQKEAIEVYGRAIDAEQASDLDEALRLYRQAFRLYDDVDRLWRRAEAQAFAAKPPAIPDLHEVTQKMPELQIAAMPTSPSKSTHSALVKNASHTSTVTGLLERVVSSFPPQLTFEPEDEKSQVLLNVLPDELIVHILAEMDHATIERFASACRKARVVSLDSIIWKTLVNSIYKPPQVPPEDSIETLVDSYTSDYRRVYIEHPRLRLDGVYIAVCHYIRSGLSENPWVNVTHLITYHRYLRFFPNGQVVSLLANEGVEPQDIIPRLKPALRMKGVSVGTWHVEASTPSSGSHPTDALVQIQNLAAPFDSASPAARYVFQMTLALRSRPLGRWNKLDFVRYESVALETGEATPFSLKHERPFWFSKVRSYGNGAE